MKGKASTYKTLIQNFSYLSVLQIFNMLVPLFTYPYLIKVLGKETYGLVVFAQAIVAYLVIVVGFGFNISATREISIHRDSKEKLSEIVSSILIIKGILFLLCSIILGCLLIFISKAHGYEYLFLFSLWACLNEVIFPIWYFEGIEQMRYITYVTLLSRLIFLGLIFIWINSAMDYLYVPIIYGIGALAAGGIALIMVFGKHKIQFKWQSIQTLKYYIKDSIPIFISNVSIVLYVNTNKVIIGSFLGMGELAYYDLAEKITSILKIPQSILSQTLFPKVNNDKDIQFIKKIFFFSIIFHCFLVLLLILLSEQIVIALGGKQMLQAIWVVNLLALSIPFIIASNFFGILILIPFGYKKIFSTIIISSGIIYGLFIFMLNFTIGFSITTITSSTIFTEIFVASSMYYYIKKLNLWKKDLII